MASNGKESAENNPRLQITPDEATKNFFAQHTMLRIKDPKVSLDFYSRILGMSLLKRLDFTELRFTIYLMGYEDTSTSPNDPLERTGWTFARRGVVELTHNWGTEIDPNFTGYHNGNTEPLGYGHIGINVGNIKEAVQRFEDLGVQFVERPEEGNMKGIAFIQDPDSYWIEILDIAAAVQTAVDAGAA